MAYKGVDLSILAQGVSGNEIASFTQFYTDGFWKDYNYSTRALNAWTPENPSNDFPRIVNGAANNQRNIRFSDRFVHDGSYLRIKNVTLGYSLPSATISKLGLTKLRIYTSGQNLLTFAGYDDFGYDPEVGRGGLDRVTYPMARTFLGGLQIEF